MDSGDKLPSTHTGRGPSEASDWWAQAGVVPTWRPPKDFGKYHLEKIIAHGGMGQVYRAWDTELERRVAIKLILGIEPDEKARARFVTEARSAAKVRHSPLQRDHDPQRR